MVNRGDATLTFCVESPRSAYSGEVYIPGRQRKILMLTPLILLLSTWCNTESPQASFIVHPQLTKQGHKRDCATFRYVVTRPLGPVYGRRIRPAIVLAENARKT